MRRMRDGTVMMELNQASKDKGYTMRSNINPDFIRALKRCKQDTAAAIREAIRRKDCKAVIREIENAKHFNRQLREVSEHHDKIVYDASGKTIFWWNHKEQQMYTIED